ncbi:MAG: hypothetical protein AVDCRST_MAG53-645, partial [uncultured Solirubrobacteraceae bacterium]
EWRIRRRALRQHRGDRRRPPGQRRHRRRQVRRFLL